MSADPKVALRGIVSWLQRRWDGRLTELPRCACRSDQWASCGSLVWSCICKRVVSKVRRVVARCLVPQMDLAGAAVRRRALGAERWVKPTSAIPSEQL